VTALGGTLEELWVGLMEGRSGIGRISRFATEGYISGFGATVEGLAARDGRSLVYPLLEGLFEGFGSLPAGCRLITATTKGGIDCLEKARRGGNAHLPEALPAAIMEWLSGRLGLAGGRAVNVSAACASSTIALALGAASIASGRCEAALVCGFDLLSEFVFSGFSALKALSPEPCRPFDARRDGLSLGDGAAALLLTSPDLALRGGMKPLGSIIGWASANDASHVTAPARDARGLVRAIRLALKRAGIGEGEVAGISAHGTGTVYNDAMELTAFGDVFGGRTLPVNSLKGAIGHTLGAAGAIETAVALKSLDAGVLPPTAGLAEADAAARGRVSRELQPIAGRYLLKTSSGFGGINCALVLAKGGAA
jgi:3-oxoacyl-[acyl-carrier-protein] synthase II